jgi:RNA polymerase sigma-70 factor (ECF subfamily)
LATDGFQDFLQTRRGDLRRIAARTREVGLPCFAAPREAPTSRANPRFRAYGSMARRSVEAPMLATDPTDADLEQLRDWLLATAGGDRRAFESLYQRTSAKLFGVCLRILRERSEAEEVLQDVYLTIWRMASLYDAQRASPTTWLAMIARNRAIDRLRAGRVERAGVPIDFADELADEGPAVMALAEAASEGRRLHDCLDELNDEQRRAIRVAFFEGCTYEELAQRSATPLGTIKSWIRRGLLRLRDCMQR